MALLALPIVLALAGPGAAQAPGSGNPYSPFKIDIPQGWTVSYQGGSGPTGQSLELTSPDKAAFFGLYIQAIPAGGWADMIEDMSVRPKPDHSPPNMQADGSFVVTYNDTASGAGMTGRKIYSRLDDGRCLVQVTLGFHPDLPALINAVDLEPSDSKK